jgi:hypothetical protein
VRTIVSRPVACGFLASGCLHNNARFLSSVLRIQKEVRHELVMLPYITVFDNLEYRISDSTVTLIGQVTNK